MELSQDMISIMYGADQSKKLICHEVLLGGPAKIFEVIIKVNLISSYSNHLLSLASKPTAAYDQIWYDT